VISICKIPTYLRHRGVSLSVTRRNGFTLVEMMVVVAIVAVLTMIAIPSFRSLIRSLRASSEANAVVSAIRFMRAEAMKRGTTVSLTPPAGQASLSNGWVIFVDAAGNRDPVAALPAGTQPLARRDDVASNMIFQVAGCAGSSNATSFSLDRTGACLGGGLPLMRILVGAEDSANAGQIDPTARRAICMDGPGRISIRNPPATLPNTTSCAAMP
jgi:prepilin-type N-terminal cleavage/methylation domain-containing protein